MENKIYNLKSKRFLAINGAQYKKLIKHGYYIKDGNLAPPLINRYGILEPLPIEIILEIIKILDLHTLIQLLGTNTYYYKLIMDNKILRNAFIHHYKSEDEGDLVDILVEIVINVDDHVYYLLDLFLELNPNIINNETFISILLEMPDSSKVIKYLFTKGLVPQSNYLKDIIDYVNGLDQKYWQDPIADVAKEYMPLLKTLLELGISPNAVINKNNDTLLHLLVRGHLSIQFLELFLQYGANPNIQNCLGNTPFYDLYTHHWDKDVYINIMLKYGADINIKNSEGYKCHHST